MKTVEKLILARLMIHDLPELLETGNEEDEADFYETLWDLDALIYQCIEELKK